MASHESHDQEHGTHDTTPTTKTSFSAAFWFVLLLVGLFIASLNFIDVMGHSGHEEGGEANTESMSHSPNSETPTGTEAAANSTHKAAPAAVNDSAAHAH